MDIGRALSYVFRDSAWFRKFLIGLALLLVPSILTNAISNNADQPSLGATGWTPDNALFSLLLFLLGVAVSLAVYGFGLQIARNVAAGTDLPLPEWTNWRSLIVDGLKSFLISILWFLIPLGILGALLLFTVTGSLTGDGNGGSPGIGVALGCLTLLVMVLIAVLLPAALARLATTGSLREGLNVPAVFGIVRSNVGDYLVILLLVVGVGVAAGIVNIALSFAFGATTTEQSASLLSIIIAGLVGSVLQLYLGAIAFHLYGQAYYRANRRPVPPPSSRPTAAYRQVD